MKLTIAAELKAFVDKQALPGTGIKPKAFWETAEKLISEYAPRIAAALEKREAIQAQIDSWHKANPGPVSDLKSYEKFLRKIGYIVPDQGPVKVTSSRADAEIAKLAGPQLVVPVMNARYALNAANARWGSLYDALYGTDVIPGKTAKGYDAARGAAVIAWARNFLDEYFPLKKGSHTAVIRWQVEKGKAVAALENGTTTSFKSARQFAGFTGKASAPDGLLLVHNGLHAEIRIDRTNPIGKVDKAGIADVVLESALTTIMDCEDSVAAVDAEDKVAVYRNWLGLMKGDLTEKLEKNGKTITRALNPDRVYKKPDGSKLTLKGRALMLVRNVGLLMTSDAILLNGKQVPEHLIDGLVNSVIALHDIGKKGRRANSATGCAYFVVPKLHGPEEAAITASFFAKLEKAWDLSRGSLKMGIMDEERRTTVNLKEMIRVAKDRVCFINTGFLDRTGDEMHTSIEAGPMIRKADMKSSAWIAAYENNNVDVGLACGMAGRAQIGKGMWAMPDLMADMLAAKVGHPKSGVSTAWVPSPTAATLHATHYHQIDVGAVRKAIATRKPAKRADILSIPVAPRPNWSAADIQQELDNNAQGILGYVVRWVDQGIGCSKVPDINDVGLMEDRATLRISSQHIANWLLHGIVTQAQVAETMQRMAAVVDAQNKGDRAYQPMAKRL
ncbi:MAG: malate synthase G, partial [Aestuariivirgaceae bacterium]|nr:malate synthase G [Aestuariivirgaceae bacterium]